MKRHPSHIAALTVFFVTLGFGSAASAIVARDYTATFYQHRQQVQSCAEGDGSVDLEIHVSPRGAIESSRVVGGDERMQRVGRCVLGHARRWSFMRSTSGGDRRYTITFRGDSFTARTTPRRTPSRR